jgi:thiamine-phosphate pyrophosphorylase
VRLPSPPLLLVTDRSQARRPLAEIIEEACAAGCRWVSLREKDLPPDEQIVLFESLAPIARRHGARLTIHGDVAIAKKAGADGVHLPQSGDATRARAEFSERAMIGISVHHAEGVIKLDPQVVDYVIAGPAYLTASKPGYGPALAAAGITAIVAATRVPVLAIGGIEAKHVAEVMTAGAAGIAVMGAVMRSAAPGCEIEGLMAALKPHATAGRG